MRIFSLSILFVHVPYCQHNVLPCRPLFTHFHTNITYVILKKPLESVVDTDDMVAVEETDSHKGPGGRVHPGGRGADVNDGKIEVFLSKQKVS